MGWVCGVMIIVQLINIVFSVLDILDRFQRDSDPVNTKSIKTYHFLTYTHTSYPIPFHFFPFWYTEYRQALH